MPDKEFDIALSFAGEDRALAGELANHLRTAGVRVFYDEFHKADLWGKDLYQHLQLIYRDKAKYCIVLVSKSYLVKNWTSHELKQAQARAFSESREYILPLRVDDSELPGLNYTIGYIDLRSTPTEEVACLVLQKLGIASGRFTESDIASWDGELVEYNGHQMAKFWPQRIEEAQHLPYMRVTAVYPRVRYGDERDAKLIPKRKGRLIPATTAEFLLDNFMCRRVIWRNVQTAVDRLYLAIVKLPKTSESCRLDVSKRGC